MATQGGAGVRASALACAAVVGAALGACGGASNSARVEHAAVEQDGRERALDHEAAADRERAVEDESPPRLTETARASLPAPITPDGELLVACAMHGCLVAWSEAGAVRAVRGDGAACDAIVTAVRAERARVSISSLVAHGAGFALLRATHRSLEEADVQLVLLDARGALRGRVDLGPMHGNSTAPALASRGADAAVAIPRTAQRLEVISLQRELPSASTTIPGAHTTSAMVAHDGADFVVAWTAWEAGGPAHYARRLGDEGAGVRVAHLDRPAFACGAGACAWVGARRGSVIAIELRDGQATEHVIAEHAGPDAIAWLAARERGYALALRVEAGPRAMTLDGRATPTSELSVAAPLGALAAIDDARWLSVRAEPPADYDPSARPCPGREDATCADAPSHYTVTASVLELR